MRITGVIQAGGRSIRMGGQPKALMELGGRRIIDRVADVVRDVADDVLIVTGDVAKLERMHRVARGEDVE